MTYFTDDKSVSQSAPVELYEFAAPLGTYRYTTYHRSYTFGGYTYLSIPAIRTVVSGTSTNDPPEVSVEMPVTATLIRDNAFGIPPQSLTCTIRRVQQVSGAAVVYWSGNVTAISATGKVAKLRIPSFLDDALSSEIPSVYFQGLCNHKLYNTRCGVSASAFDVAALVTLVSGGDITVSTVGGNVDNWFKAGEVVRDADGQRRMIVEQVGQVLTLAFPFLRASNGDAVTLFAGCAHNVKTCRDKFDNVANFGGHPSVGNGNPFLSGLNPSGLGI